MYGKYFCNSTIKLAKIKGDYTQIIYLGRTEVGDRYYADLKKKLFTVKPIIICDHLIREFREV